MPTPEQTYTSNACEQSLAQFLDSPNIGRLIGLDKIQDFPEEAQNYVVELFKKCFRNGWMNVMSSMGYTANDFAKLEKDPALRDIINKQTQEYVNNEWVKNKGRDRSIAQAYFSMGNVANVGKDIQAGIANRKYEKEHPYMPSIENIRNANAWKRYKNYYKDAYGTNWGDMYDENTNTFSSPRGDIEWLNQIYNNGSYKLANEAVESDDPASDQTINGVVNRMLTLPYYKNNMQLEVKKIIESAGSEADAEAAIETANQAARQRNPREWIEGKIPGYDWANKGGNIFISNSQAVKAGNEPAVLYPLDRIKQNLSNYTEDYWRAQAAIDWLEQQIDMGAVESYERSQPGFSGDVKDVERARNVLKTLERFQQKQRNVVIPYAHKAWVDVANMLKSAGFWGHGVRSETITTDSSQKLKEQQGPSTEQSNTLPRDR